MRGVAGAKRLKNNGFEPVALMSILFPFLGVG